MKLWIRSQERDKLEVCNGLSIQPRIIPNTKRSTWGIISNFGCVGEYPTRERCLEIIDKIQNNIMCQSGMIFSNGVAEVFVYEMPEK